MPGQSPDPSSPLTGNDEVFTFPLPVTHNPGPPVQGQGGWVANTLWDENRQQNEHIRRLQAEIRQQSEHIRRLEAEREGPKKSRKEEDHEQQAMAGSPSAQRSTDAHDRMELDFDADSGAATVGHSRQTLPQSQSPAAQSHFPNPNSSSRMLWSYREGEAVNDRAENNVQAVVRIADYHGTHGVRCLPGWLGYFQVTDGEKFAQAYEANR